MRQQLRSAAWLVGYLRNLCTALSQDTWCGGDWSLYDAFSDAVVYFICAIGILSEALRGAGKVLIPVLLTCGGVCILQNYLDVCSSSCVSGDRDHHAQLSSVMGN